MNVNIEKRPKRLIPSEICKGDNVHAPELKRLAASVGDEVSFRAKERFFKALADSTRLKIVKMLEKKEMCVCEVMIALNLTQTNASHHLNVLEREGIVKKRREGRWVFYSLSMPEIVKIIDKLNPLKH